MTSRISVLPNVELRLLRYVIAVAEELHFTRASERLHLATPSLSRQIRQLENVLGYALFERTTRAIALTPAGVAFVSEARRALAYTQRAIDAGAAAANDGGTNVVRVGYTPLIDTCQLQSIRELFIKAGNDATLVFQIAYSSAQVEQISSGYLDFGFVVLPIVSSVLRTAPLFRDRLVAAVPEGSALAAYQVLNAEHIAEEPVVWFGRLINSNLYQRFIESCRYAGFTPRVVREVSTVLEMLETVAAGAGVGFVKDTVPSRFRPEGIVFRELAAPGLSLEIGVVYRDEDCSEGLIALLQVLKHLSTSHHGDGPSAVKPGPG